MQQKDEQNTEKKTVLDNKHESFKTQITQYWYGLVIGGALTRTVKGSGVGFGIVSILEPLLLHYGIVISSTILFPFCIGFFTLAFIAQHLYYMQKKYDHALAKNAKLALLGSSELTSKWEAEVQAHGLFSINPIHDFTDHLAVPLDKLQKEVENFNTTLKKQLGDFERRVSTNAVPDTVVATALSKFKKIKLTYSTFVNYSYILIFRDMPKKIEPVKWYRDNYKIGDKLINSALGLLFGWSVLGFFVQKVGAIAIEAAFPGGMAACTALFLLMGLFVFHLNEHIFEDGFKNVVNNNKEYRHQILARTHLIDLKIRQHQVDKKLKSLEKKIDTSHDTAPTKAQEPSTLLKLTIKPSNAEALSNLGLFNTASQPVASPRSAEDTLASADPLPPAVTIQ